MTRAIAVLAILGPLLALWLLIAQTFDEPPNEAAKVWAAQMSRHDYGQPLSDNQLHLLGLLSKTRRPVDLGRIVAEQGAFEPEHPDALPVIGYQQLGSLLECQTLEKIHCAAIPTLLAKYRPALDNYDELPVETNIPFNNMMYSAELLMMMQSLSLLRVIECFHGSLTGCNPLLIRELVRARELIAGAESHLERMVAVTLLDRQIEFTTQRHASFAGVLKDVGLPKDFLGSALSLDLVRIAIKPLVSGKSRLGARKWQSC